MGVEIECDCGRKVGFAPNDKDHAPIVEECECGQEWAMEFKKISRIEIGE